METASKEIVNKVALVQLLIDKNNNLLKELKTTLSPRKSIPFKQVELLNRARRKEKTSRENLVVLELLKKAVKSETSEELVNALTNLLK